MIIIADDLTGANDTAIQFTKCGFYSLVLTQPDPAGFDTVLDNYEVISVNTDSRDLPEDISYEKVRDAVKAIKANGDSYYKKIDSVLRGNTAVDLDAMMDALGYSFAIVAPSYPENDRIVRDGILHAGTTVINAVDLFSNKMRRLVKNLRLSEVRAEDGNLVETIRRYRDSGVSLLVADALTDEDLSTINTAVRRLGSNILLAGSAGFAKQIALYLQSSGHIRSDGHSYRNIHPKQGGKVLMVAGTRHGGTANQIQQISQLFDVPIIRIPVKEILHGRIRDVADTAIESALKSIASGNPVTILVVDSIFSKNGFSLKADVSELKDAETISQGLAYITTEILRRNEFPTLITMGGDTSMKVCAALHATGIEPLEEVFPGIPYGRIIGGVADGQQIITKSGGFGDDSSLVNILKYLGVIRKGKKA